MQNHVDCFNQAKESLFRANRARAATCPCQHLPIDYSAKMCYYTRGKLHIPASHSRACMHHREQHNNNKYNIKQTMRNVYFTCINNNRDHTSSCGRNTLQMYMHIKLFKFRTFFLCKMEKILHKI